MMNRSFLLTLAATLSIAAQADVHRWKSGATGAWSSGDSWEEGMPPTAGDVVWVPKNVTAPAKDSDLSLINTLAVIDLRDASSVLQLTITDDASELGCAVTNAGKTVKSGAGTLKLTNQGTYAYRTTAGWKVTDGMLVMPKKTSSNGSAWFGPMEVNAPGILHTVSGTGATTWIKGLSGDGMLTNSASLVCTFNGGTAKAPYGFSGQVCGSVRVAVSDGYQNFTATESENKATLHNLFSGMLGLTKIGGAYGSSTTKGSIGAGNYVFRGTGGIRNLGGAQTNAATFSANIADTQYGLIDGGETGGLDLRGKIQITGTDAPEVNRLYLTGSGTIEDVMSVALMDANANNSTYVIKQGSGTWHFTDKGNFKNRGVVAVEDGTLKFDSIANKGAACSLGLSSVLLESYTGAYDASRKVPYAYLLGTDKTTGTLEYAGMQEAFCTNRYVAIKGTGCLAHSGEGRVAMAGVGSLSGAGTLVLSGDASTNFVYDVIDGNGTLGVRKEGNGVWNLGGNLDFSGGIEVRAGTLNLKMQNRYTWYRWNIKERVEKGGSQYAVNASQFGLFDADGSPQSVGLVRNPEADGAPTRLSPGELAFYSTKTGYDYSKLEAVNGTRTVDKLFIEAGEGLMQLQDKNYPYEGESGQQYMPWYDKPESWIRIVMHLKDGANPVTSYDIGSRWGNGNSTYTKTEPYSWSLEGSHDGVRWFDVDSKYHVGQKSRTAYTWYSDGSALVSGTALHKGWPIASGRSDVKLPDGISKVAVAAGAKLVTDAPVEIKSLELDAAGGGVIDGFAFAEGGTLNLVGDETARKDVTHIDIVFDRAADLQNVNGWSVFFNDRATRWQATVTATGIDISHPGQLLIVR